MQSFILCDDKWYCVFQCTVYGKGLCQDQYNSEWYSRNRLHIIGRKKKNCLSLLKKHLLSNFAYKTNQYFFKKYDTICRCQRFNLKVLLFRIYKKKKQISYNAVLCFKQIFWDFCIHLNNKSLNHKIVNFHICTNKFISLLIIYQFQAFVFFLFRFFFKSSHFIYLCSYYCNILPNINNQILICYP